MGRDGREHARSESPDARVSGRKRSRSYDDADFRSIKDSRGRHRDVEWDSDRAVYKGSSRIDRYDRDGERGSDRDVRRGRGRYDRDENWSRERGDDRGNRRYGRDRDRDSGRGYDRSKGRYDRDGGRERGNGRGRYDRDGDRARSRSQSRSPDGARAPKSPEAVAPEAPQALKERKPVDLGRGGGVYIPPFRLKQMMAEAAQDKDSEQYQKMMWEALRKTLNGIINKVNAANIKAILPEIFHENLIWGKGILCQALLKAQAASPTFTPVFAALVAVINSKLPEIGRLLCERLLQQFIRAYKRSDKPVCAAALRFIAHATNQHILNEVTALEILILLLNQPTDDGVELTIGFIKEVGAELDTLARSAMHEVFGRLREILQDGQVSKKTQFQIEGLLAIRKAGFESQGFVAVKPELDLIEEDDQIEHEIDLETKLDVQRELNVFKYNPDFEKAEAEWAAIRCEILGEESDADGSGEEGEDDDEEFEEEAAAGDGAGGSAAKPTQDINDMTATDLVNLRRTLYLTLMSAATYEEAGHKLMKLKLPPGQEPELCAIIIECCSQEKTFLRFYALLAQRFCLKFQAYCTAFEDCFVGNLQFCHRLETNKIRNIAKLFAHLLGTQAISWEVLSAVRITEADTTSATRIFYKCLFQELAEHMGLQALNEHMADPRVKEHLSGVFPHDSMANMRFSINFFTAVGLGGLTPALRADLKKAEAEMKEAEVQRQLAAINAGSASSSGSSSSSGSESGSGSDSGSDSDSGGDSRRRRSPRSRSRSRARSRSRRR